MTYCIKHSIRDYCNSGWRLKPDKGYESGAPIKLVHWIPDIMYEYIKDMASWHLPWWDIRPRVSFRDITCWHLPPNWPQLFVVSLNGSSVIFSGQPGYNPPKGQLASSHFISPGVRVLLLGQLQYCNWPQKYFWDSGPVLQYWGKDYNQKTGKTTAGNMMMTKFSQRQKASE